MPYTSVTVKKTRNEAGHMDYRFPALGDTSVN